MSFAGIDFRGMTVAEIQRMEASIQFTPMQSAVPKSTTAEGVQREIMDSVRRDLSPQTGVAERTLDYHRRNGTSNDQRRERFRQEYRAQQEINEKYFDSEEAFIDHMIAEEGESNAEPWANFSADPDPSPGQSDEMSFIRPYVAPQQAQTQPATNGSGRGIDRVVQMVAADGDDFEPANRGYEPPVGTIDSSGFSEINFHGVL